jgi:hypothetical protein
MCNSLSGKDYLIVWQEKPIPYFGDLTPCNLLNFSAKSCTPMIFKDCLNMLALCTLGFHYQERKHVQNSKACLAQIAKFF